MLVPLVEHPFQDFKCAHVKRLPLLTHVMGTVIRLSRFPSHLDNIIWRELFKVPHSAFPYHSV